MAIADVANGVVNLYREGKGMEAIEQYYADNVVSIEPVGMPELPARMEGIEAVRGKSEWWYANHEIHSATADGPRMSATPSSRFASIWT